MPYVPVPYYIDPRGAPTKYTEEGYYTTMRKAATREEAVKMANDTSTNTVTQDSPLLKLPNELKHIILERVMPTNTTIIIRAHAQYAQFSKFTYFVPRVGSRVRYQHDPAPPPILCVCKELRDDGNSLYYGSNNFYFTDVMFQPLAIAGFSTGRGQMLQKARSFKISHQYEVREPYKDDRGKRRTRLKTY